ncbi:hypothetical protein OS493_014408 [Desmophyllum pertusum]|uniref:Enoyl-CoA hydratase n=1 Tax=Desmophyllum pertusum TaxID=174260 RepID=A0A9W9YPN4_9CNID|nr:hypothetical protein OS493_014408 [Desmophyllum pertusum]
MSESGLLSVVSNMLAYVSFVLKKGSPFVWGPTRLKLTKPVIGAIEGLAVAGGMELALMCDLRVVAEDMKMGIFNRRLGFPMLDGGSTRLPFIVGLSRALDLILTGRPVDANEALSIGLANRVVPKGKAVEEATKLAKMIAGFPGEALKADRKSAYYSMFNADSFCDALTYEYRKGVRLTTIKADFEGAKGSYEDYHAKY